MKIKLSVLVAITLIKTCLHANVIDPEFFFVDQGLTTGSVQFPKTVKHVPNIPMFCAGNKAKREIDHERKKIIFNVLVDKRTIAYYILICERITPQTHEGRDFENLVKYLQVQPNIPYKLYRVSLVAKNFAQKCASENKKNEFMWNIEEMELGTQGRLPDQTIIIHCNPDWIEGLEARSTMELPIIKIRPDILAYVGSEGMLHHHAAKLSLTSLDMDVIHAKIEPDFQLHGPSIVAMVMR